MRLLELFIVAAACYGLNDLRNAECNVGCKHIGYDGGYYAMAACYCVDRKDFKHVVDEKRLVLPKRKAPASEKSDVGDY